VEVSPSFSPDGNHVAFAWWDESRRNFDIFVKMVGGGDPVRLTRDPAHDFSPAWSPDGRFIAYLRTLSPFKRGVFLVPPIGGRERMVAEVYLDGPAHWGGPNLSRARFEPFSHGEAVRVACNAGAAQANQRRQTGEKEEAEQREHSSGRGAADGGFIAAP